MPAWAGAYRYACDLRDGIAREVFFTHGYAPQETALVRALLRPGHTFVDVGANWGYFTLLGAHLVGPHGRVVAFEPDPRLFRTLAWNLRANALSRVRALPLAAADRAGGRRVWWLPTADAAAAALGPRLGDGDILITIGAGDIHKLAEALVDGGGR